MDFGRALRIARAARGMSQRDLAERSGVQSSYVSMLESGRRSNPSSARMERFAEALEIPLSLLMVLGASRNDLRHASPSESERLARALLDVLTEAPGES